MFVPTMRCIGKQNCLLFFFNQGKCWSWKQGKRNSVTTFTRFHSKIPDSNAELGKLNSDFNLETWVANLTPIEKNMLLSTLMKQAEIGPTEQSIPTAPVPLGTSQLFHVGLHYSLPFVGFGFLDNFIMIIAGDYIDLTVGSMLGISTMAAAGIGNAISDVAGVGSAQFVESVSHKLGVPQPKLNPQQFTLRSTIWAINIGRAIGVALGCLLGMIPLLFLPTSESRTKKHSDSSHNSSDSS